MRKWFVLLVLFAPLVFAYQDRTFDWTPPTQYEDGSPLAPAELEEFRIYCNGNQVGTAQGDQITWQSPDGTFPPGSYDCYATAVAGGLESQPSNTVNFTVSPSNPNPPSQFVVR